MSFERFAACAGSGRSSISARRHPTEPQCQNACRAFPVSHVETGCASAAVKIKRPGSRGFRCLGWFEGGVRGNLGRGGGTRYYM